MEDMAHIELRIENTRPVDLVEFSKSLTALANEFVVYANRDGANKDEKQARLYIHEVRKGSIIVELIEYVMATGIPLFDAANTLIQFHGYIGGLLDKLTANKKAELNNVPNNELSNIHSFLTPIVTDGNATINISITNGDNSPIIIDSIQARKAQNCVTTMLAERSTVVASNVYNDMLLTFEQVKKDKNDMTKSNKGRIDALSDKAMIITFATQELKEQILYGEHNPLQSIFVVNVEVQTVGGVPKAYKVTDLSDIMPIESNGGN